MADDEYTFEGYWENNKLLLRTLTREHYNMVQNMGKRFGVEVPKDFREKVAMDPEAAHQWAVRTIRLEKKFKEMTGQDNLDRVPDEKLKEIEIDPVDVQGAKLSFVQLYSRLFLESESLVVLGKDMTPRRWSLFRGNGRLFEEWSNEKYTEIGERIESNRGSVDALQGIMEELEAVKLVSDSLEGSLRSGNLVTFAQRVEKAHQEEPPGQT